MTKSILGLLVVAMMGVTACSKGPVDVKVNTNTDSVKVADTVKVAVDSLKIKK